MAWRSRRLIAFTRGMSISVKRVRTQVPKALHWIDTPEEEKQQMAGKRHVLRQSLVMRAVNMQKKDERHPIKERLGAGGLRY